MRNARPRHCRAVRARRACWSARSPERSPADRAAIAALFGSHPCQGVSRHLALRPARGRRQDGPGWIFARRPRAYSRTTRVRSPRPLPLVRRAAEHTEAGWTLGAVPRLRAQALGSRRGDLRPPCPWSAIRRIDNPRHDRHHHQSPTRSPSSPPWRRSGGTPPASSSRCTSSTRFGSAISATRPSRTFGKDGTVAGRSRAYASSTSVAAAGCSASRWRGWARPWLASMPASSNIRIAELHAEQSGLAIDYRATTAEALAAAGERFDIVLNMEVVEHVDNVPLYMKSCAEPRERPAACCSPPPSTGRRAPMRSRSSGRSTCCAGCPRHPRFLEVPDTGRDLGAGARRNGLKVIDKTGVVFHPLADEWRQKPRPRHQLHGAGGKAGSLISRRPAYRGHRPG